MFWCRIGGGLANILGHQSSPIQWHISQKKKKKEEKIDHAANNKARKHISKLSLNQILSNMTSVYWG